MAKKRSRGNGPNRKTRRAMGGKGRRRIEDAADELRRKARMGGIDPESGAKLRPIYFDADRQPQERTFTSSGPWIDAQFVSISDTTPEGETVSVRLFDPSQGPPLRTEVFRLPKGETITVKADEMRPKDLRGLRPDAVIEGQCRCPRCGFLSPPHLIGSSGHCEDCKFGAMSADRLEMMPGSRSAVSMRKLRAARGRGDVVTPGGM